jgi:hypothetical protein
MTAVLSTKRNVRVDPERAMRWRHPGLLRRYCADFDKTPEEAEQCFIAFKQFLVVCALADGERVPAASVDGMWHTALLFSHSYLRFCEQVLGEVVHHEPIETAPDHAAYAAARADALALFGELSEVHWPGPGSVRLCGSKYPGKDCPSWPDELI